MVSCAWIKRTAHEILGADKQDSRRPQRKKRLRPCFLPSLLAFCECKLLPKIQPVLFCSAPRPDTHPSLSPTERTRHLVGNQDDVGFCRGHVPDLGFFRNHDHGGELFFRNARWLAFASFISSTSPCKTHPETAQPWDPYTDPVSRRRATRPPPSGQGAKRVGFFLWFNRDKTCQKPPPSW